LLEGMGLETLDEGAGLLLLLLLLLNKAQAYFKVASAICQ
jgi:hypothetical protein